MKKVNWNKFRLFKRFFRRLHYVMRSIELEKKYTLRRTIYEIIYKEMLEDKFLLKIHKPKELKEMAERIIYGVPNW